MWIPVRSNDEYMASDAAARSPLTQIMGFHLDSVYPELMHAAPLGVCAELIGSVIKELCSEGRWPSGGGGAWQDKLQCQLTFAYDDFCRWAKRAAQKHTEKRFTVAKLSLKTLRSWPTFKSKAHNALVVQEWLGHVVQEACDGAMYKELRATVVWAFVEFFQTIRSSTTQFLSDNDVSKIAMLETSLFKCYNQLSQLAADNNLPLYKMIPKHHCLFHIVRDCIKSHRNPAHLWSFRVVTKKHEEHE